MDEASSAALLFVARRLETERVALMFAARDGDLRRFDSGELPELVLGGIDAASAARLLTELRGVQVADDVRDLLMSRTGGNPLALVELPGSLSPAQLAGLEPLPADPPLTEGVQRVFLDRSRRLSTHAQTLLCVAAADDSTRVSGVRQAAELLGVRPDALTESGYSPSPALRSVSVTRLSGPPSIRVRPQVRQQARCVGPGDDRCAGR